MTNPLGIGAATSPRAPFADMAVGETRTCNFPGGKTRCGSITITKTGRGFIHDWVDAVNEIQGNPGFEWIVGPGGEPSLVSRRKRVPPFRDAA